MLPMRPCRMGGHGIRSELEYRLWTLFQCPRGRDNTEDEAEELS